MPIPELNGPWQPSWPIPKPGQRVPSGTWQRTGPRHRTRTRWLLSPALKPRRWATLTGAELDNQRVLVVEQRDFPDGDEARAYVETVLPPRDLGDPAAHSLMLRLNRLTQRADQIARVLRQTSGVAAAAQRLSQDTAALRDDVERLTVTPLTPASNGPTADEQGSEGRDCQPSDSGESAKDGKPPSPPTPKAKRRPSRPRAPKAHTPEETQFRDALADCLAHKNHSVYRDLTDALNRNPALWDDDTVVWRARLWLAGNRALASQLLDLSMPHLAPAEESPGIPPPNLTAAQRKNWETFTGVVLHMADQERHTIGQRSRWAKALAVCIDVALTDGPADPRFAALSARARSECKEPPKGFVQLMRWLDAADPSTGGARPRPERKKATTAPPSVTAKGKRVAVTADDNNRSDRRSGEASANAPQPPQADEPTADATHGARFAIRNGVGMTVDHARAAWEAQGLTVVVNDDPWPAEHGGGDVLVERQVPPAGSSAAIGDTVRAWSRSTD